jgi:hypothetical protein
VAAPSSPAGREEHLETSPGAPGTLRPPRRHLWVACSAATAVWHSSSGTRADRSGGPRAGDVSSRLLNDVGIRPTRSLLPKCTPMPADRPESHRARSATRQGQGLAARWHDPRPLPSRVQNPPIYVGRRNMGRVPNSLGAYRAEGWSDARCRVVQKQRMAARHRVIAEAGCLAKSPTRYSLVDASS